MLYIYNCLALYIVNNVNNMTFVGSYCLFLALVTICPPKVMLFPICIVCFSRHCDTVAVNKAQ